MKKSILLVMIVFLVTVLCGCKSSDYKKATQLMQAGDYEKAANLYRTLEDYKDAEERTIMLEVKAIMVKYQKYYDEMNELSLMNFNAEVKPLEEIISEFEELDMEKISQYPDLDEYVQKVVTANFGFEWLIEKDRGYLDALFNGTVCDDLTLRSPERSKCGKLSIKILFLAGNSGIIVSPAVH